MDLKIFTNNIEEKALEQINTLAKLEAFKNSKIRIMPDVHVGKGCVIGFTATLGNKVIPNIVGVDIGCGMYTIKLGNININFEKLDNYINQNIPNGFNQNQKEQDYSEILEEEIKEVCKELMIDDLRQRLSVGTLGGGNHFIEISIDKNGDKYLIIHTGSRNFGYQVAKKYQQKAIDLRDARVKVLKHRRNRVIGILKKNSEFNKIELETKIYDDEINILSNIPKELCYLEKKVREKYLHDMNICQNFATENREVIAKRIISYLGLDINKLEKFQTIHNYIEMDTNIVRKGAISAKLGEKVLIPINMRDGSILAIGKGNKDWNNSAPHGAGRIMSRTQAKNEITLDEFKKSMKKVYTTSVCTNTIDECPMAYKPIEEIISNIKDSVEIIDVLKPIYNFKAKE